LTYEEVMVIQI